MDNSDFDFVDRVFCALVDKEERQGSKAIGDIERVVLLAWHASGIIGNGGFYYFVECGLPFRATGEAYARIGVDQAVIALRTFLSLFPGGEVPEDYDERMAAVERVYGEHQNYINRLEADFCNTDTLMTEQLAGWIRVHKDIFLDPRIATSE